MTAVMSVLDRDHESTLVHGVVAASGEPPGIARLGEVLLTAHKGHRRPTLV